MAEPIPSEPRGTAEPRPAGQRARPAASTDLLGAGGGRPNFIKNLNSLFVSRLSVPKLGHPIRLNPTVPHIRDGRVSRRVCRVFPSSFKCRVVSCRVVSCLFVSQSQSVVSIRVYRLLEAFVCIRVYSSSWCVYSCSCLFVFVSSLFVFVGFF